MATLVISPGEFLVSSDRSDVFKTTLGSCVAVAMWDPHVMVGGMIHVLLPSGREEKERSAPGRYARSAVPLLLSEMMKMGASSERIVAHIAGGASMLTDRPLSIEMNIGESNSEMVRRALLAKRIPIVKQDLGGQAARVLCLHLGTGRTEVLEIGHDLRQPSSPSFDGLNSINKVELSQIRLELHKLKPLPEIARKIILRIESSSQADLEKDILKDQALTAGILRVSNSAYYGFRHQVTSIRRAFALLGLETVKKIILSVSFFSCFGGRIRGYSTRKGDLMKHSVSCGLIAELIAKEKGIQDADAVFTAGLLHDIGKVILDQYAFEKFNMIMDRVYNDHTAFLDAENQVLGFNHAQVGGMVAREWNLPALLTEAISLHHQPELSRVNSELVSAVHLADNFSSMFGECCGLDELSNGIHQFSISTLNLRKEDVERIVERLPDVVRQLEMI